MVSRLRGQAEVLAPPHSECDITDSEQVFDRVCTFEPGVIINCAAVHDAKTCERQPELAKQVNTAGALTLSLAAHSVGARFIHFSTDQVLKAPPDLQDEDARLRSYDTYSLTKFAGEVSLPHFATIIRISALYGHTPCRGKPRPNFVEQVFREVSVRQELKLPANVGCSPGYVEDIAEQVALMLDEKVLPPVIHLAPEDLDGAYSWFRLGLDVASFCSGADVLSLILVRRETKPSTGLVNMTTRYKWKLPPVRQSLRKYFERRGFSREATALD